MCRSIRRLFNVDPPAQESDVRAAAIQFVRKVSGYRKPSKANQVAFDTAVDEITHSVEQLLRDLKTRNTVASSTPAKPHR